MMAGKTTTLAAAGAMLLAAGYARAQTTYNWRGASGANSSWAQRTNWSPTPPVGFVMTDQDAVVFYNQASRLENFIQEDRIINNLAFNTNANLAVNIQLGGTQGARMITFAGTAPHITVDAGSEGNHVIGSSDGGTVVLNADLLVAHNGTGTLEIGRPITQDATARGVTKTGSGTLVLTGENTYAGGTTVTGGVLALGENGTLGRGDITINAGATLDVSAKAGGLAVGDGTILGGSGTVAGDIVFADGAGYRFGGTLTVNGSSIDLGNLGVARVAGLSAMSPPGTHTLITGSATFDFSAVQNLGPGNAATLAGRSAYFLEDDGLKLVITPGYWVDSDRYRILKLRLLNPTDITTARVYWATMDQPEFSEERSVEFAVDGPREAFRVYHIPLHGHSEWSGRQVVRMKIDDPSGTLGEELVIEYAHLKETLLKWQDLRWTRSEDGEPNSEKRKYFEPDLFAQWRRTRQVVDHIKAPGVRLPGTHFGNVLNEAGIATSINIPPLAPMHRVKGDIERFIDTGVERLETIYLQSVLSKPIDGQIPFEDEEEMQRRYDYVIQVAEWLKENHPDIQVGISCALFTKNHDYKKFYTELKRQLAEAGDLRIHAIHLDHAQNYADDFLNAGPGYHNRFWKGEGDTVNTGGIKEYARFLKEEMDVEAYAIIGMRYSPSNESYHRFTLQIPQLFRDHEAVFDGYTIQYWWNHPDREIPEADPDIYSACRTILGIFDEISYPHMDKILQGLAGPVLAYGFEAGSMQDWTEVAGDARQHFALVPPGLDSPNLVPHDGDSFIGLHLPGFTWESPAYTQDSGHDTLVLRSPPFMLNGAGVEAWLCGGTGAATGLAGVAVPDLPASSSPDGFLGIALRDASTETYVLSARKSANGQAWERVVLSAQQLDALPQGHVYTLDLIDSFDGGWGWINLDSATIPGGAIPGGGWNGVATISLRKEGDWMRIAWPLEASNAVVQASTNLVEGFAPMNPAETVVEGDQWVVYDEEGLPARFYRLVW